MKIATRRPGLETRDARNVKGNSQCLVATPYGSRAYVFDSNVLGSQ